MGGRGLDSPDSRGYQVLDYREKYTNLRVSEIEQTEMWQRDNYDYAFIS